MSPRSPSQEVTQEALMHYAVLPPGTDPRHWGPNPLQPGSCGPPLGLLPVQPRFVQIPPMKL